MAGERAHQHQQRALRQVEVGQQQVDDAELEARRDEEVGFSRALRRAVRPARAQRGGFERAQAGRADGDDRGRRAARVRAIAAAAAGIDLEALAVHDVLGDASAAHRLERAGADVQRHRRALDAARGERGEQRGVEVQPAVGAATAPGRCGEHRLVALAVDRPRRRASMYGGSGTWPKRSSSASGSDGKRSR